MIKEKITPITGRIYNHYDDGKVSESRLIKSFITKIYPYQKGVLNEEEEEDFRECDWLYNQNTDVVVEADLFIDPKKVDKIKYVRTLDGGWFSLGFWGGRLDVDNSLTEGLRQYYLENGVELKDYYEE